MGRGADDRETPVVNDGQPRNVTVVLVHGGFLGPWIWADTVELLREQKIPSVCVDLLSSREKDGNLASLHDDARAVREILDGYRDVVLCGHPYAGLVVSEAAAAIALLRPLNPATGTQAARGAAWRDIPSTYVRGTQGGLPYEPVAPAFREHAASMVTLPTGHCPQWIRPDLVAELLTRIVTPPRSA
jgi:pimeloyl-ACP methyl ester carboxylesterase